VVQRDRVGGWYHSRGWRHPERRVKKRLIRKKSGGGKNTHNKTWIVISALTMIKFQKVKSSKQDVKVAINGTNKYIIL